MLYSTEILEELVSNGMQPKFTSKNPLERPRLDLDILWSLSWGNCILFPAVCNKAMFPDEDGSLHLGIT